MSHYINNKEAIWRILDFLIHDRGPAVFYLSYYPIRKWTTRIFFYRSSRKNCDGTTSTTNNYDSFFRTMPRLYFFWKYQASHRMYRVNNLPIKKWNAIARTWRSCLRVTRFFESTWCNQNMLIANNCIYCFTLFLNLTCFEDLRTSDGYICETHRKICQRLGLLENDNYWESAMSKEIQKATANGIWELFAIKLATYNPLNLNRMWLKY